MGELEDDVARRSAEKVLENRLPDASGLRKIEIETQTHHNFRTEDYFIKIERYFNQRERISVEPVVLENIDIKASTTDIVDYGNINGYIYLIFEFVDGKSLDGDQEESFEDLGESEQTERIRQIGEALAKIHQSRSFDGFGNIDTIDDEIVGTSSDDWSEGLRDIQHFWHHYVGGEPFEDIRQDIEDYYRDKKELLNQVEESVLIHQEAGFHNLLFQEDSITVVDWESTGAGDPLLDIVITEVILFWFQGLDEELRQVFRESYLSVREIRFDEELVEIYRLIQLTRLLIVIDDEEKLEKIKQEISNILK